MRGWGGWDLNPPFSRSNSLSILLTPFLQIFLQAIYGLNVLIKGFVCQNSLKISRKNHYIRRKFSKIIWRTFFGDFSDNFMKVYIRFNKRFIEGFMKVYETVYTRFCTRMGNFTHKIIML